MRTRRHRLRITRASGISRFDAALSPSRLRVSGGNGLSAVLRSVAALDFQHVLGCAVNVKFHPTAVGERDEIRKKWVDLIRTYFKLGGQQIQPTVVSAEDLRDAQKNPQFYGDLIVKVGGYSAYFTELGIEIQNEVIARTEHQS